MKTKAITFILFLIIFTIALFVLFSCEKDKEPGPPNGNSNKITFANITTNSVSYRSASFTCSIDKINNNIQQHGFCWDTQENPDIIKNKTELGALSNAGEFSDDLTNLQPDKKYYIKAYITFNNFTIYSKQTTFTTNPLGTPTVTTNEITNVLAVSAQCGGNVTSNCGSDVTARGICLSTSQNPTITDSHTTDGTGTGIYTSELTELDINTNYYVRAYETNSVGTAYGLEKIFTTNYGIPDLTTTEITNITGNSAVSGGNITDNGGLSITTRGVCWSTSQNPTITDSHTTDGTGTGIYTSELTELDINTNYYVRAYATNNVSTAYGQNRDFIAWGCGSQISYMGQNYNTVLIGNQCWMKENLNVGTRINGSEEMSDNGTIEKYCYDDVNANCDEYGGLYQWDEMMEYATTQGVQGICPDGWHLPGDDEWTTLTDFLGGTGVAGGKMKEADTAHWNSPNTGATNSSGFTGLPGGYRDYSGGSFGNLGYYGRWWSSSEYSSSNAWRRGLSFSGDGVYRGNYNETHGFSVRCLKD